MRYYFDETTAFSAVREQLIGDDESFRALQNALLEDPRHGEVIQGSGGARKLRWGAPGMARGKRG